MTYTLHPRHMVIAKVISYGQVYLISTHLAYMFTRWLSSTFTSKFSFHNTTICEVVLCQCLAGVYCAVFRHNDLVNMVFKRYLWLWMSKHLSHPDILLWYVGKRCRSCHYSHTRQDDWRGLYPVCCHSQWPIVLLKYLEQTTLTESASVSVNRMDSFKWNAL